jgi:hypothetical protein
MAKMGGNRPPADYDSWDFRAGRRFETEMFYRFGSSVHHPSSSVHGSFFLLAVFRRSVFCLTEESVGMAFHSVLGGSSEGFHIRCIKPCHFRFSVASRNVGFLICNLRHITTASFDVYFHLWRDGGANWQREILLWEEEEEPSWTMVSRKKNRAPKKVHFSSPIRQSSPRKKSSPLLAHRSINFGNVRCNLPSDSSHSKGSHQPEAGSVLISQVFGSLRSQLQLPGSVQAPHSNFKKIPGSNSVGTLVDRCIPIDSGIYSTGEMVETGRILSGSCS